MPKGLVQRAEAPGLSLTGEQFTRAGLWDGDAFELLIATGRALATGGDRPYLAGQFQVWSSIDVLAELFAGRRTGELHARCDENRTELHFRNGDVAFGSTSNPRLHLGPVLVSHGWIQAVLLTELAPQVSPAKRLGKLLEEKGALGPADLYRAVVLQCEEIVLDLLSWERGSYLFAEGPVSIQSILKLSRQTRELCAESARRRTALGELRQQLPGDALLVATAEAASSLAGWIRRGLEAGATVGELCRAAPEGEHRALRELAAALELGFLKLAPARPLPPEFDRAHEKQPKPMAVNKRPRGSSGAVKTYRRVFKYIHRALQKQTGTAQQRLNSFFVELPAAHAQLFQGVRFEADGNLSIEDVLSNAEVLHDTPQNANSHAMEALETLLAFALFEARDVLEGEKADQLLKEVGKLQTKATP